MEHDPALSLPLPHRLDVKPNVFLGLNWPELVYAFLLASGVSMGVGLVLGIVIGDLMIALPTWIGLGLLLLWVFGNFMARFKHNRPYGYYQQKIYLVLQRIGLGEWFITQSGYRDPRRLNCDYSPEELTQIRLMRFLTRRVTSQPVLAKESHIET